MEAAAVSALLVRMHPNVGHRLPLLGGRIMCVGSEGRSFRSAINIAVTPSLVRVKKELVPMLRS